ncbi:MAG TPA: metal-dependent hydrolase, partial [Bacteroidota bacterium]
MIAPTHIAFSWFVYLLLLTTTGVPLSLVNGITVALASVLPDLDSNLSGPGAVMPFLARWLETSYGHRTVTHSLLCVGGLALLLLPVASWDSALYVCFLTGYASHPFLDTMTLRGVRLFYPFSNVRCVFPLDVNHPGRYRTTSGSKTDVTLSIVFLLGCVPSFLIAQQGYERFIRFTQRNIESAVRDYNEYSRTHRVDAEILAHNLLSKEHLEGRFRVIGAVDQHTLIFRDRDGKPRSLGNEYQADFAAEKVLCVKGGPVRIAVRQVTLKQQPLSQVLAALDPAVENQLFGRLSTPDRLSLPVGGTGFAPVTGSSGTVHLAFALPDDLRDLGLEDLFVERGNLTIRTIIDRMDSSLTPPESPPGPAPRFTRVTFQVPAREPVELLCRKGDTVLEGERLARWGEMVAVQAEIDLLEGKLAALGEKVAVQRGALYESLRKAHSTVRDDSISLAAVAMMLQKGFA